MVFFHCEETFCFFSRGRKEEDPLIERSGVFHRILPTPDRSEWLLSVIVLKFTKMYDTAHQHGLKPDQIGSECPNSILVRCVASVFSVQSNVLSPSLPVHTPVCVASRSSNIPTLITKHQQDLSAQMKSRLSGTEI